MSCKLHNSFECFTSINHARLLATTNKISPYKRTLVDVGPSSSILVVITFPMILSEKSVIVALTLFFEALTHTIYKKSSKREPTKSQNKSVNNSQNFSSLIREL
jgi:hypothetical protein